MHEVAHVDIRIDRDSGTPAYRQIYQQIRHQIAAGSIPAGALIPKIHDLAASLDVARDTVEAAYRQLSLEGYAHGKRGIGYVVEDLDFSVLSSQLPEQDPAPASVGLLARRKSPFGDSLGCRYDFSYGNRDYLKIPTNLLKTFAVEALDEEMMHLFMSSSEWARYERTTVNSYRRRHDALIASIHEYPGDKVRIVGADVGLHILLAMARNATSPSSSTSRACTTCASTAPTAIGWETPAPCATSCWSDSRRSARRTSPRGYGASGRPGTVDVQRRRSRPRACARENERAPASGRGRDAGAKREEVSLY